MLCTLTILKPFVIRSFFFKKWLLTHGFGWSQSQKSACKQACIRFPTFYPWYPFYQNLCDLQYSLRTLQWFLQCIGYIIGNVNKRKPKGPSPFHTNILSPFIHICIQKRPGIPSTWSFRFLSLKLTPPAHSRSTACYRRRFVR